MGEMSYQTEIGQLRAALAASEARDEGLRLSCERLMIRASTAEARVAEHDVWAVGMAEALSEAATAADAALAREATLRRELGIAKSLFTHQQSDDYFTALSGEGPEEAKEDDDA